MVRRVLGREVRRRAAKTRARWPVTVAGDPVTRLTVRPVEALALDDGGGRIRHRGPHVRRGVCVDGQRLERQHRTKGKRDTPPSAAARQRRGRITSASSSATSPTVATWLPIATRGWTPGSALVAAQSNRNDRGHVISSCCPGS